MRIIEAHNQEAALGMQSFEMAMNHLGDMVSTANQNQANLGRRRILLIVKFKLVFLFWF